MISKRDIAGLFMTHFSDRAWDDAARERERVRREVAALGVCGYCVFGGEVERAREFNEEMTKAAGGALLVASDLEQGLGQQLAGGTVFPSQMAVGAAGSVELAELVGRAVALEARSVGMNIVFAPVADLATEPSNPIIGVRAFGADPEATACLTAAYVSGCQSAGVAATAKHFPGHGDTKIDSHIDLPTVAADRRTLDTRELVPFRAALAAGVRVVMVGHIAFPTLAGEDVPATLAPSVGEDLLRRELGFDGLVITDALLMGAVTKRQGSAEAAVLALLAGADVLLMPENLEEAIEGISAAVGKGRIPEERVSRSLGRMSCLRGWLSDVGDLRGAMPDTHGALAGEVAARAVTLISNEDALPLGAPGTKVEHILFAALVDAERPPDLAGFASLLESALPSVTLRTLSGDASSGELARLVSDAKRADALVLLVFDQPTAWRGRKGPTDALASAAGSALRASPRSAAVIFAGPELVPLFADADAVICCYDGSLPMQAAALNVLVGRTEARGLLPAPVPERG